MLLHFTSKEQKTGAKNLSPASAAAQGCLKYKKIHLEEKSEQPEVLQQKVYTGRIHLVDCSEGIAILNLKLNWNPQTMK